MKYKIEKNIPYKRRAKRTSNNYPFEQMDVGDSFFVAKKDGISLNTLRNLLLMRSKYFILKNNNTWKFSSSVIGDDGVRIWRTQ